MLRIVFGGAVLIALLLFSLGTALVVGLQGRGLAALNSADYMPPIPVRHVVYRR